MATSSIMDCKTCNIPDVNCYEQCRQAEENNSDKFIYGSCVFCDEESCNQCNGINCNKCRIVVVDEKFFQFLADNAKPKSFWNDIKEAASKEINREEIDELFRGCNNKLK